MNKIQDCLNKKLRNSHNFVYKLDIKDQFITFDYSKTHLTDEIVNAYAKDFKSKGLFRRINEMYDGHITNFTEDRKVLHTLLRKKEILEKILNDNTKKLGTKEEDDVYEELLKMKNISKLMKEKELKGVTGEVIDTIVNIGIGGSDLGPRMVCEALQFYKVNNLNVHFISNVDATESMLVFDKIDPLKTLFIVVSKTFTTQETLSNAKLAIKMFLLKNKKKIDEKEIIEKHFVAVSSNKKLVEEFGISRIFDMWDFVGGRYSLWSAVGLSICLYIGFDNYVELLQGANAMDNNFLEDNISSNIPLFQAIVELYYCHEGYNNKCVLPYDTYLSRLPAYFQQAEMESNGKSATKSGEFAKSTSMIIWGEVGTNSQHSFFQLLHQGTRKILCDFYIGIQPLRNDCEEIKEHHKILYGNCIAQTEALMLGDKKDNKHKNFDGDKPSMLKIYSKLTPGVLGALVALVEHKIFCQGIFWDINSFDQFGVELGKSLAKNLVQDLEKGHDNLGTKHDKSTSDAIKLFVDNKDK